MEGGGAKQYGVIGFLLGHLLFMLRLRATMTFPCNTTVTSMEVVELEDTILLRKALMCSGVGSFSVYWTGRVVVSQPILVANGSVLVIAGQGPHASIVDGEGRTRLFEVDGANLELKNVSIAQGLSPNGSGVYAHGVSRLSVSNCSFANNAVLVADLHYSNGGECRNDWPLFVTEVKYNEVRNMARFVLMIALLRVPPLHLLILFKPGRTLP